jgi:hypothetical protein
MRNFLTLILVGLVAAGCSPSAHVNSNPPEAANPTPVLLDPVQENTADPTSSPLEARYVDLAKQDLAGRLKIDISQITVLNVTVITGADLSSGCILKGGQVLMPNDSANGYQVSLAAEGRNYLYHAGSNDQVVLCQNMNLSPNKPLHNPTPDLTQLPPGKVP